MSGSHNGESEDGCLPECRALKSGRLIYLICGLFNDAF